MVSENTNSLTSNMDIKNLRTSYMPMASLGQTEKDFEKDIYASKKSLEKLNTLSS